MNGGAVKVLVFGREKEFVRKQLKKRGLVEVSARPDAIICVGGDGTLLLAEQKYPAIPKILVKHSSTCRKCSAHDVSLVLRKLAAHDYVVLEAMKIEATINGARKFVGLNEINVHYKLPEALRFSVSVNGKTVEEKVIGDGLVIATPFGSSAYFHSITRETFSTGIGVAFNNPTVEKEPLIVDEKSVVKVRILKENGFVACDNNRKIYSVEEGDCITVKASKQRARLIQLHGEKFRIGV